MESTKIAEINNASQEQATGVIKVNKSMGEKSTKEHKPTISWLAK
ncbi:hypothetical protein [Piscirickettsia salmonis]|nr:hypothetical protein [Piscirickettsia salmonis]